MPNNNQPTNIPNRIKARLNGLTPAQWVVLGICAVCAIAIVVL